MTNNLESPTIVTLTDEVTYFYYFLTKEEPKTKIIKAYIDAHTKIESLRHCSDLELADVHKIILKQINPYGIEFWLRDRVENHVLCQKLSLLNYLVETGHDGLSNRNRNTGFFRGGIELIFIFWAGLFILLRGRIQKFLYGIV